jgi:hypothetical protein
VPVYVDNTAVQGCEGRKGVWEEVEFVGFAAHALLNDLCGGRETWRSARCSRATSFVLWKLELETGTITLMVFPLGPVTSAQVPQRRLFSQMLLPIAAP